MNRVKVNGRELVDMNAELIKLKGKAFEEFLNYTNVLMRIEEYLLCNESMEIKRNTVMLREKGILSFDALQIHINKLLEIARDYDTAECENIEVIEET